MNSSSKKLRTRHNYKQFGDTCKNCRYFKTDASYGGVDGMYADSCHVDDPQDVHVLMSAFGVCDEHERTGVRGSND